LKIIYPSTPLFVRIMCYYAVFILAVTECPAMFTTIDKFVEDINLYCVDFIEINA